MSLLKCPSPEIQMSLVRNLNVPRTKTYERHFFSTDFFNTEILRPTTKSSLMSLLQNPMSLPQNLQRILWEGRRILQEGHFFNFFFNIRNVPPSKCKCPSYKILCPSYEILCGFCGRDIGFCRRDIFFSHSILFYPIPLPRWCTDFVGGTFFILLLNIRNVPLTKSFVPPTKSFEDFVGGTRPSHKIL